MIELHRMSSRTLCELYNTSMRRDFPENELKPLRILLEGIRCGSYSAYTAYTEGRNVGYLILYQPPGRIALLDYIAVEPAYRGRGIGTQILLSVEDALSSRAEYIMVESEEPSAAPNEQEALNRLRFYYRAGANDTGVKLSLYRVTYRILMLPAAGKGKSPTTTEIMEIYKHMLPPKQWREELRVLDYNGREKAKISRT